MPQSASSRGQRYLALFLLILAVIFWGFSFISTKVVLAELPPVSIAFFRQIVSVIVLLPLVLRSLIRERFAQLSRATQLDAVLVASSGLFGIVLYFIFENNGIRLSTAANASMIVAAVPVFTLMSEVLFFKLKITARILPCLALSILGVYLVISGDGRLDLSSARTIGNLLVVGAMVCWVSYTIINKRLTDKYSSLLLTYFQALFSLILFLPFILPEMERWRVPGAGALLHLLYLGVCCSALGYIFYVFAVKRLGATISSAFLNLVPVVTVAGGLIWLRERITGLQLLGMGLVMASLYALSVTRAGAKPAKPDRDCGGLAP